MSESQVFEFVYALAGKNNKLTTKDVAEMAENLTRNDLISAIALFRNEVNACVRESGHRDEKEQNCISNGKKSLEVQIMPKNRLNVREFDGETFLNSNNYTTLIMTKEEYRTFQEIWLDCVVRSGFFFGPETNETRVKGT